MTTPWDRIKKEFRSNLEDLGCSPDEFNKLSLKDRTEVFNAFKQQQLPPPPQEGIDHKTRFRQLAESAAISVTDVVMKNVVFHFASQMTVVTTAEEAAELYKRASRIPGSATEIVLKEENISVGEIYPGTDTAKSVILEAFEDGSPCLLKIADKESIDHEMNVWKEIEAVASGLGNLVPLRILDIREGTTCTARIKNLAGRMNEHPGVYRSGILMEKYQSTLSRCKSH